MSCSWCFPLACSISLALFFLSSIFFLSLSNFNFTISTLLGWMPTGTELPLAFSRWMRSIWIIHLLRYTCVTLPCCCPLKCPRVTTTSSSFLIGIDLTLYFCLNSLLNGALRSFLRTLEGAEKCLFLLFRREELTFLLNFIATWWILEHGSLRIPNI